MDELSMEGDDVKSVGEAPKDLINLGIDMSHLQEYMDNIIKVVNQHARLLDKVSDELAERPKATSVGELFALLSHAYPYSRSLR